MGRTDGLFFRQMMRPASNRRLLFGRRLPSRDKSVILSPWSTRGISGSWIVEIIKPIRSLVMGLSQELIGDKRGKIKCVFYSPELQGFSAPIYVTVFSRKAMRSSVLIISSRAAR